MSIAENKMPWDSYTEMLGFIGLIAGLIASFNLIPGLVLTAEQIAGIASLLFLLVLIARTYGSGGKIVFKKADVGVVEEPKAP
jgi:hypothetical protein